MDVRGAAVAGRYELRERVGAGGSGTVFRAWDRLLYREVAVKRLRAGADAEAKARLRLEAQLCGALSHPGIVRILDVGEDEESPYLVMELVEGPTLREVIRDRGALPPERVMSIVAQLADALAVAHAAGIVHRDVKPGNVLVRPDGTVALVDFGIARGPDLEPLTLTGMIIGTADYISPEQAAGASATRRSDLYALGMVAFECLTGDRPLRRDSQVATLLAHVHEDVPPLPRSIPVAVREVVQRLTARDARRRPRDASSAARLARQAVGLDGGAVTEAEEMPLRPDGRGRRRWLALVPIGAAAALLACLVVLTGRSTAPEAAARAAVAESTPAVPASSEGHGPASRPQPSATATAPVAPAAVTLRHRDAPAAHRGAAHRSASTHRARPPGAGRPGHGRVKGHPGAKGPKPGEAGKPGRAGKPGKHGGSGKRP